MAMTEKSRHDLHSKLEDVLGAEPAGTLMAMLPPVGWADVATKRDLDALQHATSKDIENLRVAISKDFEAMDHKMTAMEHKMTALFRHEMMGQTRTVLFAVAGFMVPYGGAILAAAKFL